MNKITKTLGLLSMISAPMAAAADLPSITTLGVAVKDQTGITKPSDFAQKVASAVKLDQSRHGCRWAVMPEIYAFADGLAYTKAGSDKFNVFTLETANAQGCSLPSAVQQNLVSTLSAVSYDNQADMNASYSLVSISDVKSVKNGDNKFESYYKIGDRAKPAPATLLADMKMGLQLTQAQHACSFAARPYIFVFSDAVAYVNSKGTDVNIYSIAEVTAADKGCKIPTVRKGERRNLSFVDSDTTPEMAAETGLDDINQAMNGSTGNQTMSKAAPTALRDNLRNGTCAGRWTFFDKWTTVDVDFSKFTIEVTDAIITGNFKQSIDRSAVRTIRFPVSYSKYYTAGDSGARGSATRFAHTMAGGICQRDAQLQTITTKGLSLFQATLPLSSPDLKDANDPSVHAFKEAVSIPGDEVCSNHVQSAGKRVCNRVTVTDICEVRYFDAVREQVVVTKTYSKNIDSKKTTVTALRQSVPGIARSSLKNPANVVDNGVPLVEEREPFNESCNTFDDLPLDTQEHIQERYKKLEYNIKQAEAGAILTPGCQPFNSPDCSLSTDPDFVGWIKNIWGLSQEYNEWLTPEQRAAIRELHILFPKYLFPGDEEIIIVDVDVEE